MLTYLLIGIGVLLLALLIAAAKQPDHYRVARSILIHAKPSELFEHCQDLQKYLDWNPFGKMDPEAKQTLTAYTSGPGSSIAWDGKRIGAGSMTTIESKPHELLRYKMEFLRPMTEIAEAQFAFIAAGSHTEVVWSISGTNSYMRKLMGLFLNFDKMIGGSFASGLKDLKALVEASPAHEHHSIINP
jgi:Polyketide cyclase / dehydrase and lipid transport